MTRQSKNNLLSPNRIKVVIDRFPNLEFYAQTFNLPGVNIGTPDRFTNKGRDYNLTGDKIVYNDMNISFIVDENLNTFTELFNWLDDAVKKKPTVSNVFSDMTIMLLSNNSTENVNIVCKGTFPYMIGDISFSTMATEDEVVVADVTFKITEYEIKKKS